MHLLRKTSICVVIFCIATVGLGHSSQADTDNPVPLEVQVVVGWFHRAIAFVQAVQLSEIEQAADTLLHETAAYVEAVQRPAAVSTVAANASPQDATTAGGGGSTTVTGGGHSDAWWQGVAMCEQSGNNDSYYGYFSFMDGSQGGKPWAEQVAAGNALLAQAGHEVGPWAAACVDAGYAAAAW